MQFFLIEIEIKISLLTKSGSQEGIYRKIAYEWIFVYFARRISTLPCSPCFIS
jgi:hypothetical protein